MRCSRALALIEARIGLTPEYGYGVPLDLALPWKIPVPLVSGQGNMGRRTLATRPPVRTKPGAGCRPSARWRSMPSTADLPRSRSG